MRLVTCYDLPKNVHNLESEPTHFSNLRDTYQSNVHAAPYSLPLTVLIFINFYLNFIYLKTEIQAY